MSLVAMKRFWFRSYMTVMLAAAGTACASEANTEWKDEANARIVRLHQREVRVRVVNEQGAPASGTQIAIRQIRQAFPFGSAMSRTLLRNERYAEFFKAHFNCWTVPDSRTAPQLAKRNSGTLDRSAFSTMNFSRSCFPCLTTRNCGSESRSV